MVLGVLWLWVIVDEESSTEKTYGYQATSLSPYLPLSHSLPHLLFVGLCLFVSLSIYS